MKKYLIFFLILITLIFLSTCTKNDNPNEPEVTDEDAIRNLIGSEYMNLLGNTTHYGIEDTLHHKGGKPFSPILTYFWYRWATGAFTKDFQIDVDNDTAIMVLTFTGLGDLYLFYLDDSFHFQDTTKPFTDDFTRRALFVREDEVTSPFRGWKLKGLEPAYIYTPGGNLHIDSAVVTSSDSSYHFTYAMLNGFIYVQGDNLNGLMTLKPHDTLAVTMYTHGDSADAYVHISWENHHRRARLMPDTLNPGVFTNPTIPLLDTMPEYVNLCFDILEYSTIYTTEEPYYSQAYIIPFRIDH